MARRYRGGGKNPYIKSVDEEKIYNYDIVMDEAHQRWRVSNWRARPEAFTLKREQLSDSGEKGERPSAARFKLDVKKDLLGDSISLDSLKKLTYSPSYRPKGKLNERLSEPMSNPRRYDVLAGLKEAPPEDLQFLSDADVRRAREDDRPVSRRRDTRRLETSVDERRSAVIRMIPEREVDDTSRIIDESKRRRAKEDNELGRARKEKKTKKRFSDVDEANEAYFERYLASETARIDRLPQQPGMGESSQQLPEFERETRNWSKIDTDNPSWSELMQATEIYVPEDESDSGEERARYIHDDDYNPRRPFKGIRGIPPRPIPQREGDPLTLENEYVLNSGIDPQRIRQIMKKQYRGRWIPPAFFNDDALVCEYFNQYNRGDIIGEDFVSWAQRQRAMVDRMEEERLAYESARMARHRSPAAGRRGSPFAAPAPRRAGASRELPEDARRRGVQRGRDIVKEQKDRQRADYERYKAQYYASGANGQYYNPMAGQPGAGYTGQYPELFDQYGQYNQYSPYCQYNPYAQPYQPQYPQPSQPIQYTPEQPAEDTSPKRESMFKKRGKK